MTNIFGGLLSHSFVVKVNDEALDFLAQAQQDLYTFFHKQPHFSGYASSCLAKLAIFSNLRVKAA